MLWCILSCFLCPNRFVPVLFPFSYSSGISGESRAKTWGQSTMLPGVSSGFTVRCPLRAILMPPFRLETSGDLTREGGDSYHAGHEFPGTYCLPSSCGLLCHTPKSGDGSGRIAEDSYPLGVSGVACSVSWKQEWDQKIRMLFYCLLNKTLIIDTSFYAGFYLSVPNFIESGHLEYRCLLKNSKSRVSPPASWAALPIIPAVPVSVFSDPRPSSGRGWRPAEDAEGSWKMWMLLHSEMNGSKKRTFWKYLSREGQQGKNPNKVYTGTCLPSRAGDHKPHGGGGHSRSSGLLSNRDRE